MMLQKQSLPDGWIETRLSELLILIRNGLVAEQEKEPIGTPISRIETISNGIVDFKRVKYVRKLDQAKRQQYLLQKGDILFSHINSDLHLGKTAVFDSLLDLLHGMNLLLLRVYKDFIDPYYVNYFLNFIRVSGQFIAVAQHAVNQSSLNQRIIRSVAIRLAPLNEQKRIVDKIELLFSDLEEGEALLKTVQKQLTTYRQSVLRAAVTGELTRDWREQNKHHLEPGAKLLERILQSRRKNWQGRGRYKEPSAPDIRELPELPDEWVWASLDTLITDGPTNGLSPKSSDTDEGVKSFKLTATTSGEFIINDETVKVVKADLSSDSKFWLKTGDLLVQRGNTIEYVGTAAIFPGPDNEYIYPDLMIRLRVANQTLANWVVYWLNFYYAREYFKRNATGTAGNMPKINGETLKRLAVPITSEEEISIIVSELDNLKNYVSVLNYSILEQQKRCITLRQSILKAAFSGKLVPQDLTDEPASELLKRIRSARSGEPSIKSTKVRSR